MPYASIVVQPAAAPRTPRLLAWLCAFALAAGYRFVASFPAARNADDANNFLAGMEMVRGNWLLHGWTLAPDNFAPTDVLAQGLASLVLGYRPVLMGAVEALIWASVAMVAIRLAIRDISGRTRPLAGMVTLALVIFGCEYARPGNESLSGVGSHGFTILLILLTFQIAVSIERAVSQAPKSQSPDGRRLATLASVVTLGSFADPLFITIGALPLLATCGLHWRRGGPSRPWLTMAGSILAGVLLSRILLALGRAAGGFESDRLTVQFATFNAMLDHLRLASDTIVALFGADFFGRVATPDLLHGPMLFLLRFPFVVALSVVLVQGAADTLRALSSWPGRDAPAETSSFLNRLLWVSMLFCIAGSLLTTVMVNYTSIRFFLPVLVAGSILIVRRLWAVPAFTAYASLTAAASILLGTVTLLQQPRLPALATPASWRLAATLRAHGLHHGYGGYWQSSLTTILTRGDVRTLTLAEAPAGTLQPFRWFSNVDWYRNAATQWRNRVFFITTAHPASPLQLNQTTIIQHFGTPEEIIHIDDQIVDIYDWRDGMLGDLDPPQ